MDLAVLYDNLKDDNNYKSIKNSFKKEKSIRMVRYYSEKILVRLLEIKESLDTKSILYLIKKRENITILHGKNYREDIIYLLLLSYKNLTYNYYIPSYTMLFIIKKCNIINYRINSYSNIFRHFIIKSISVGRRFKLSMLHYGVNLFAKNQLKETIMYEVLNKKNFYFHDLLQVLI